MDNPSDSETLGQRIKRFRNARAWSQPDLAEAIKGICGRRPAQSTISKWERDEAPPESPYYDALPRALEVSYDDLFGGAAKPYIIDPEKSAVIRDFAASMGLDADLVKKSVEEMTLRKLSAAAEGTGWSGIRAKDEEPAAAHRPRAKRR